MYDVGVDLQPEIFRASHAANVVAGVIRGRHLAEGRTWEPSGMKFKLSGRLALTLFSQSIASAGERSASIKI